MRSTAPAFANIFQQFSRKILGYCQAALKWALTEDRVQSHPVVRRWETAVPRERRKHPRIEQNSAAALYDRHGRRPRPCIVANVSTGGAKITGVQPEHVPDEFLLRLTPHSPLRKCHIVWRSADALGVEFIDRAEDPIGSVRHKYLRYEPGLTPLKTQDR
jgi:PilZ domain